jgi:DNA-binding SARP family transcriptional activator/TolB-like protein
MLELRTLGQLAVVPDPPASVFGAGCQPKPLALLAFLAAAGVKGASRDRVLASLWPEADEARARRALRQTLYALRRDLTAPDLFQEATALSINPTVMKTDLISFDDAFARGAWDAAVHLYRGPFLDGFYLQEAPEFERWVESERSRLAERHREALEHLAIQAGDARDHRRAAAWWRRVLAGDPLNGRVVIHLMEQLVAAGELENAIECARTHETQLSSELGTGPDPAVARLAGTIRATMPLRRSGIPARPSASAEEPESQQNPIGNGLGKPSPWTRTGLVIAVVLCIAVGGIALEAKLWRRLSAATPSGSVVIPRVVAVLPFEDVSPSVADRYFGVSLPEGLARQLGTVASVRPLGPSVTAPYRDSPDRLSELGKNLGVDGVVDGTVRMKDGRLEVTVHLTDAGTGRMLWSRTYSGSAPDLLTVQGDIARGIVAAMGLALSAAEARRMEQVPTTDAGAYDLYLRSSALSYVNRVENLAGIALLEQAVRRDSSFAFALATLARRFAFHGFLVDPTYGDSGMAAVQRALSLQPGLGLAHTALGDLESLAGRPSASRLAYLKALDLDPYAVGAMADLSDMDATLGRFDEALYWALRAIRFAPGSPEIQSHVGVALYFLGDDAVTERWLLEAERRWPDYERWPVSLARLDYARGRDSAAIQRLRNFVARDPGNEEAVRALAGFAALIGTPDAEALVKARLRASPDAVGYGPAPESFRALLALLYRRRGNLAGARALEDTALTAAQASARGDREASAFALDFAALYALRGDTELALGWLERSRQAGEKDYRFVGRDPFYMKLRGDPRFQRILQRMEAEIAAMRERAEETNDTLFHRH